MISNCLSAPTSQSQLCVFLPWKRRIINPTCICAWYNFIGPSKISLLSFCKKRSREKNISLLRRQHGTNFVENVHRINLKQVDHNHKRENNSLYLGALHIPRVVSLCFCFNRTASVWIWPFLVTSTIARRRRRRNMRTGVWTCANMADNFTGWRCSRSGAWSFANFVSTIKYSRLWDVNTRSTAHL